MDVSDDKEKFELVCRHIQCPESISENHKIVSLPPPDGKPAHMFKVEFDDASVVKTIISNANKLKSFKLGDVYLNYDEPFHTRKENNRLRKEKAIQSKKHPNDTFKISKGKLYQNDIVIDKFNLSNQIF